MKMSPLNKHCFDLSYILYNKHDRNHNERRILDTSFLKIWWFWTPNHSPSAKKIPIYSFLCVSWNEMTVSEKERSVLVMRIVLMVLFTPKVIQYYWSNVSALNVYSCLPREQTTVQNITHLSKVFKIVKFGDHICVQTCLVLVQ